MRENELLYNIALTMVPKVGAILARSLISHVGSAEEIFKVPAQTLQKIPNIGKLVVKNIKNPETLQRAEKELQFIADNDIDVLLFSDKQYPCRLKNCIDAPILLFTKGKMNLNATRVVSIVGTRNATSYGKDICDELVKSLAQKGGDYLIVSGLAYGIDVQAHKSSLKYGLPTVGVVGHGVNMIYPAVHRKVAQQMLEDGGIVSDFTSQAKIDPGNFIRRNRIVAGLSDATVVVESAKKGGALITAEMAQSYNRDVFAFSGRANDIYSKGCNRLIRNNGAALISGIEDLEYFMGWEDEKVSKIISQPSLFVELTDEEQKVVDLLKGAQEDTLQIDQIALQLNHPVSKIATQLINLEFKNVIVSLPGNCYKLK